MTGGRRQRSSVLRNDIAIVLLASATQRFEDNNEEDNADAGAGEHALGRIVP